jgi:hypothetical protein
MDKLKNTATTHANKLQYVFLIGAGIAAINTLSRADYNFVIYLYMFYVWMFMDNYEGSQAKEKVMMFYVCLYSLLIDIIWCFLWGAKWGAFTNDPESGTHTAVIVLSWIGVLIKIVVLGMIGLLDWSNIKASLPKNLAEKLNQGQGYNVSHDEEKDEGV